MALDKTAQEMLWIAGWNQLFELLDTTPQPSLVDSDWRELTEEQCKALIQELAYESQDVQFSQVFVRGAPAIQVAFKNVE